MILANGIFVGPFLHGYRNRFLYTQTPFPHYYACVISHDREKQRGEARARVKYYNEKQVKQV